MLQGGGKPSNLPCLFVGRRGDEKGTVSSFQKQDLWNSQVASAYFQAGRIPQQGNVQHSCNFSGKQQEDCTWTESGQNQRTYAFVRQIPEQNFSQ
jgi:hypothetical protein